MKAKYLKKAGLALFLSVFTSTLLAGTQMLQGHVPAAVAHMTPVGTLAETNRLDLAITLPLRNQAALSNLLSQIYDPASPQYHHYLTPEEFTEQFGPTENDYQTVIAFAQANGLQVTATWPNRALLDVSGTADQVERALHLTLNVYRHPTENRNFYAPSEEPSLDLSVPILHISGLDNFELPRPRLVASRLTTTQNASPNLGSGPGGGYMGTDFRAAYVPDSSRDGSGQMVGLLEFDGYSTSDINNYESQANLPNVPLQSVLIDGATGGQMDPGGADVEVALDMEVAISMATNLSKVVVYIAPNGRSFEDILNSMVLSNQIKQFSCSWYMPDGTAEPAADQIWEQMAAQGQSFFNASGDSCAYTGLIPFPGDSSYITQVGGTTLSTTGPGGAWSSETAWNWGTERGSEYNGVGSSGGVSTQYPIPSWQTNISMAANQGSTTSRNTPDVAMTGDNVYVRVDGDNYIVGGTSCAAPLWAGFAALVNQQAAASGKPSVGFINPALDIIGSGPNYTLDFHDIATGNNTWSGSPSKFYAVTGYDLCTGWGTPAGQKLIDALANPEALVISPTDGFVSMGGVGGPFTVTSDELSLTNYGTNVLTWTLTNTSLWLNVSSSEGTLTPGGPAAMVTVSLDSTASNLVVGTYSATLWITNVDDGFGQGVSYTLNVIAPPTITSQPTDQAVLEGATAMFTVSVTGGLPLSYQWQLNGTNLTDGGNFLGSQTTNLTVSDVSDANLGNYDIIVTNLAGVAVSSNAILSFIPSLPVITAQPTNQTAVVGQTVVVSVSAVGNMPLSYQWSFDGINIIGATNSVYSLPDVQLTNTGTYSVIVTNILGSTASSNAMLTVLLTPPCDPPSSGIVSWWPGEGNADDIIGTNNGILQGSISFGPGEVGEAFLYTTTNDDVRVPASPSLNVAAGGSFTVEAWINPTDVTQSHCIFEWNNGSAYGSQFYVTVGPTPGSLYANIVDTGGTPHKVNSVSVLTTNVFQHVALTYDHASGTATMYCNGAIVGQQNLGSFTPQTSYDLYLGRRPLGFEATYTFSGLIDEPSIYNRALSSNEIAAIYNAGSGGKCPPAPVPPVIVSQPTNQTVAVGQAVSFSVVAGGTAPLSYQWSFDGTDLSGATNATLTLTNVQLSQAGTYEVEITNAYGSTNSANAILSVYGVPPFITTLPINQTIAVGGTVRFSVVAGGTPSLSYQWSFDGTDLSGATNATLTLTNVQLSQAGTYGITITNVYGSTNASAMLTVELPGSCDPAPSGIVSWWPGEGNADDIIGTNNGILQGSISFGPGEVGEAFLYTTTNDDVRVPASPSLNVAAGGSFTVEAWINPTDVTQSHCIFEWNNGSAYGSQFYVTVGPTPGSLYANIVDTGGTPHKVNSVSVLTTNVFQHVALTYDHASGTATMYCNGAIVGQQNLGSFTPQTSYDLYLGRRPLGFEATYTFSGLIDEPSIYNRALSSNEIAAVYNAGSGGKCRPFSLPFITEQPTNVMVSAANNAVFTVAAGGSMPLGYQWTFNGTNSISGATNSALVLTNVQFANEGSYSVTVTNLYGSATSSNAILIVTVDHFAWNTIPSPRYVNSPFNVEIVAQDAANGVFTNYAGIVFIGSTNGVPVSPTVSSNFVNGIWTGTLAVAQTATNLVFSAVDGSGHAGFANPINIVNLPQLTSISSGSTLYISWPTNAAGFVLETSTNLISGSWRPVSMVPLQFGGQYVEPIVLTGTNAFYRLKFSGP